MAQRRYRQTDKGRATHRRYRQSWKGRVFVATLNARRIMVGERCHGYAKTVEHAARINAHIKERVYAFKAVQRAEAYGHERDS